MPVYILKYFEKLTGKLLTKNSNLRYIAGERALDGSVIKANSKEKRGKHGIKKLREPALEIKLYLVKTCLKP